MFSVGWLVDVDHMDFYKNGLEDLILVLYAMENGEQRKFIYTFTVMNFCWYWLFCVILPTSTTFYLTTIGLLPICFGSDI